MNKIIFFEIIIIVILISCNSNTSSNSSDEIVTITDTINNFNGQQENTFSLDTNSIIREIRKKYYLMVKSKNYSRIESSYEKSTNEDTSSFEYSGDYSITENWDSIFYINDSLILKKYTTIEENQIGEFYHNIENYYNEGKVFFVFDKEKVEMPFNQSNNKISEVRIYYYNQRMIRYLCKELIMEDIYLAEDSILNVPSSENCNY